MNVILLLVIRVEDNQRPLTNQSGAHQRTCLYHMQTSIFQLMQGDIAVYCNLFQIRIEILNPLMFLFFRMLWIYFSTYLSVYSYLLSFFQSFLKRELTFATFRNDGKSPLLIEALTEG